MPKPGPRSTYRYSDEFKATAVKLSQLPGVLVNDVAVSLAIHPNMLTLWRKRAREGLIVTKGVQIERRSVRSAHDAIHLAVQFVRRAHATTLPSNASRTWSGTRADLSRKAEKMERAIAHMLDTHRRPDAARTSMP